MRFLNNSCDLSYSCYTPCAILVSQQRETINEEEWIMMKYKGIAVKVIRFAVFLTGFLAFWILFDVLYSVFITQSGFQFSVAEDILKPLIPAVPIAISLEMLRSRRKAEKHGSERRKENELYLDD